MIHWTLPALQAFLGFASLVFSAKGGVTCTCPAAKGFWQDEVAWDACSLQAKKDGA